MSETDIAKSFAEGNEQRKNVTAPVEVDNEDIVTTEYAHGVFATRCKSKYTLKIKYRSWERSWKERIITLQDKYDIAESDVYKEIYKLGDYFDPDTLGNAIPSLKEGSDASLVNIMAESNIAKLLTELHMLMLNKLLAGESKINSTVPLHVIDALRIIYAEDLNDLMEGG